jgi:hypothetical protein
VIAANAVTSAKIADGTIVNADVSPTAAIAYSKLALTNSIVTSDLTDASVTDAKVANGISYAKLSGAPTSLPPSGAAGGDLTGTYPNPVVAANAVTSAKIADGTIVNADVSPTAAIAYSKLALTNSIVTTDLTAASVTTAKISSSGASSGDVLTYNGTNVTWAAPAGGSPSGAAGGSLSGTYPNPGIASGAIGSTEIADGSISNGDIAANAITTSKVANLTVTTSKLADSAVSGLKLLTKAVTPNHMNMSGSSSGDVLTNVGGNAAWATPTGGPPSGTAGGSLSGSYPNPTIANAAVTLAKISSAGAATNDVITYNGTNIVWAPAPGGGGGSPSGAAGGSLSGNYPNPGIASGAIGSTEIADGSIVNADVSSSAAIAYSKLNLTNSIINADIAANAITTSKVANGTVTTSKLADSAVSGLKLLTRAVTSNHIAVGGNIGDVLVNSNGANAAWQPALKAVFVGSTGNGATNGNFSSPTDRGNVGIEAQVQAVCPRSGTLKNLYVRVSNAPGAGASRTITVRINGVNTTLTATVAGAATSNNNTANSVSISAGDYFSLIQTDAGGAANATVSWGFELY